MDELLAQRIRDARDLPRLVDLAQPPGPSGWWWLYFALLFVLAVASGVW